MELPAAGCKLLHLSSLIPQLNYPSVYLGLCQQACNAATPDLLSDIICHRSLSANRLLMQLVKTCRGGLGSAPACPRTADFPELRCLFPFEPDEQKQKYALHYSHSTVFCLPMKKCEANFLSLVPIFTQDTIHTMGQCCE